jgi:single-strand DNA-binding protein
MSLPSISGEFGVVQDPELRISGDRPWVKIRGVAKDRKKSDSGEWEDGDPCYIDIIVGGKIAENLMESVTKGDAIIVTGTLTQREWVGEDGKNQKAYSIRAASVGVSTRFGPASTTKFRSESNSLAVSSGASSPEEAPF